MIVNTIQLSQWRKIKDTDIELIDTTVKSGIEAFAPTWDMVKGVKEGTMSEEEYTSLYKQKMIRSYMTNQLVWNSLINKDKVAIACYCKPSEFCHRHLLVNYLKKLCEHNEIEFVYAGEIE
jgi:uncharacterized protein YeaO (DUF488 family)